jgi:hypothetical protein
VALLTHRVNAKVRRPITVHGTGNPQDVLPDADRIEMVLNHF